MAFLKFFTTKYAKTAKIILCVSSALIEDTYSVVWKLEIQLIIKPRIIIQDESGEKINEQRREYLV